ncbi:hypothetical protein CKM354_000179600 [Cercospora kikuchii]|uniref:Uncharacterized protein n=1 Tax=Cercospora kikuchii TaxID=84275 RepID=A0A9P3C8R0_9PEZI|nr:uncharacterized protein CKM354_000179600 [Cercospora kikuchii]GIZ38378.1 hypothetical protein CKM354_000179600 [Cercospora kikuchii]
MAAPSVEHHFNGDGKLLTATADRRTEIRKALVALQQELQRLEGHPVQVTSAIKFNVLGPIPKEHVYTINVTDAAFNADQFARTRTPAERLPGGSAASPVPANHVNGRRASVASSLRGNGDDESEGRPTKRARLDGDDRRTGSISDLSTVQRVDELTNFVKSWHNEWKGQGGWLFDALNGVAKTQKTHKDHFDRKLDTMQDVLGQSINSATATEMAELVSMSKLIPWLEQCRKTNADKVQAREEKWRSSSATFHDHSRREREAAEARIEKRLETQHQILMKLAESNGIDVDEENEDDEKHSEASLGAQLTAELNSEAQRAEADPRNSSTVNID